MQIRWIADPTAAFTKALDMGFDGAAAVLGGTRSQRFALKVEDGKVTKVHLEADATAADGKSCIASSVMFVADAIISYHG